MCRFGVYFGTNKKYMSGRGVGIIALKCYNKCYNHNKKEVYVSSCPTLHYKKLSINIISFHIVW
jgi:hypothetical protein